MTTARRKNTAAAVRRLPSGACTLTVAADLLHRCPTQTKRALARAGIRPMLWVEARGGRRLPVFDRRRVLDLAQARSYVPPKIGGLRPVAVTMA